MLANTSREWVWTDLAVPVGRRYLQRHLSHRRRLAGALSVQRFALGGLFVENDEQLDKCLEVRDSLPDLRQVVVYDMEDPGRAERPSG